MVFLAESAAVTGNSALTIGGGMYLYMAGCYRTGTPTVAGNQPDNVFLATELAGTGSCTPRRH
jgi:hypothetical protein